MVKRKRTTNGVVGRPRQYKRLNTPRSRFPIPRAIPGYTSTTGYYGRYRPGSGEKKFFDTTVTANTTTPGAVMAPSINLVAGGTGESQRIGRKMTIKSIHFRGHAILAAGTVATAAAESCRMLLVLDKQNNGAGYAAADLLNATVTDRSFLNLSNSQRFVILKDWYFSMSAVNTNGATPVNFTQLMKILKYNKKCNIPIEFATAGATLADVRSNNLSVFLIGTDTSISILMQSRIRYTDD